MTTEEEAVALTCTPAIRKVSGFEDKRESEAAAFDELLACHLPSAVRAWHCNFDGWTFDMVEVTITVANNESDVTVAAVSDTMPRRFLDAMRKELRHTLYSSCELDWNAFGFAILLLQLIEQAVTWLKLWKDFAANLVSDSGTKKRTTVSELIHDVDYQMLSTKERERLVARWNASQPAAFRAQDVVGWYSFIDNTVGLDLSSVEDTAKHLLGMPFTQICKRITHPMKYGGRVIYDDLRILHVEPVFRHDLVRRFLNRKAEIYEELLQVPYRDLRKCVPRRAIRPNSRDDTIEALANFLAQPSVSYHGCEPHALRSVVRYGFTVPGQEIGNTAKQLEIRCGASYGIGIYSSPDPHYSLNYSNYSIGNKIGKERPGVFKARDVPGERLVVCATLMGRAVTVRREETLRTSDLFVNTAHSHVSDDQMQYVVFDSAQIIPVYVVHLDKHPDLKDGVEDYADPPPKSRLNPDSLRAPGDEQRKKQALKAAATKWFPYGFGRMEGTSFVIEDMAEASDDEEIYGEFQHQRIEQDREIRDQYQVPGASWLDQYQTVRKTKVEVRCRED